MTFFSMLKTTLLLSSMLVSVSLVATFGFVALAVCFGLCLLTVIISSAGVDEAQVDLPTATRPAPLSA